MIIGEIGNFFNSTHKVDYFSNNTLLDYDALIVDFNAILKSTGIDVSSKIFEKRKNDFIEFVKYKKVPIIYFTPINRDIVLERRKVDFYFFAPLPSISFYNESGRGIKIVAKTIFTDFLEKYKKYFTYNSYLKVNDCKIICKTNLSNKTLAIYSDECVFLPHLNDSLRAHEKEFLEELVQIVKRIHFEKISSELPDWANRYLLPGEKEINQEISNINKEISKLEIELSKKTSESKCFTLFKKLFTSSGEELELGVKYIFESIGFEILKSEENRDDLVVKYKDKIAVVEVKGVSKSAAESHSAQLEKWAAIYFEKNSYVPKAILIVNTFKDIPVNERIEDSFPHQMLKYSKQREHCLITTLDLLSIYYSIINNISESEEVIESLFLTSGVFKSSISWKQYIKYTE